MDGLIQPQVVADQQYDVETQMKKPLILQNKHDLGKSVDDLMAFYNPDKYHESGARVQFSKNVTSAANFTSKANKTANVTLTSNSSANATSNTTITPHSQDGLVPAPKDQQYEGQDQLKQPLIWENRHDWSNSNDDIKHFYNPNKYDNDKGYLKTNVSTNASANASKNARVQLSKNVTSAANSTSKAN